MRSAAVISILIVSSVLAAPLTRRQDATSPSSPTAVAVAAAPASPTGASGESAVLDASIPILQAIAETDPTDQNAVAALQQQLAALPADQQQAITALVTNVSSISQQFANVDEPTMHLIENYITSNLSPIQEEFFINELTGQPAPNQPGGELPSDLSKQFKKLPADERKAYALMALAIGPTDKQMTYIQKKLGLTSSGSASAASTSDSDASSSGSGSPSKNVKDKKKSDKKKSDKKKSSDSDDNSSDSASAASVGSSSPAASSDASASSSSGATSSSSSTDASASAASPSAADIQAQLACLSPSDAQTLLQQIQAQGATADQVSQIQAQIPSLNTQNWTAPASCAAAASKRSLADLD